MKKLSTKAIAEKRQKAVEMENVKVVIDVEQKAISIDKEEHTAIFVMSTVDIDRHGDIVDQDSWILQYFKDNPSFYFQHESWEFPLGKWLDVWFEDDPQNAGKKMLVGKAKFSVEISEKITEAWAHVEAGNMKMCSVGFIPHRVEYDEHKDAFILYDCELMECSLVGTGSNRRALIKDAKETIKDAKDEVVKEIAENPTSVKANRKRKAVHILNKALRQLT